MRSSNTNPAPHSKQRYLPFGLRIRMESYRYDNENKRLRTREKIIKYIEKHRHQPDYLNAFQCSISNRGSIFSWAVSYCIDIAMHILECDGVDVNQIDLIADVPLVRCLECMDSSTNSAADRYNILTTKLLSYPGVNVMHKGWRGIFPLVLALKKKQPQLAMVILQKGDYGRVVLEKTLKLAIAENYTEVVKMILATNRVAVDLNDLTPAMDDGYVDIVTALLDFPNLSVNPFDHRVVAALQRAASGNRYQVIKCFIDRKLDIGVNLFVWAAHDNYRDIIDALLARDDFDVNKRLNNAGETALHCFAACDFAAGVELLFKRDADVNSKSGNGASPLIVAVRYKSVNAVSALLKDSRIDLTIVDNSGKTALMIAAENGMTEVVAMLLKHDAGNVNAQDENGDTALILAARAHDDAIIIKALLSHGADPQIENHSSYTALMAAKKSGHKGLCPLLKGSVPVAREYYAPPVDPLNIASAPPLDQSDISDLMSAASVPPLSLQKNGLFGHSAEAENATMIREPSSDEYAVMQKPGT